MPNEASHHYIAIYKTLTGWQTALMAYYYKDKIWDVVQIGFGPYKNIETAQAEAKGWAKSEDIPYKRLS